MTLGTLLASVGRTLLWTTVAILFLRGVTGTLAAAPTSEPAASPSASPQAVWPDDGARAFASDFARAFLTVSPGAEGRQRAELERFASPDLVTGMLAEVEHRQVVQDVQITRTRLLDRAHAVVTVAARVATKAVGEEVLFLAVPVGRDTLGRLAVSDLPALDSPPRRGTLSAPETLHNAPPAVQDLLTRFLRSYLAGDTAGLTFLTPPDVHIDAIATPHDIAGTVTARTIAERGRTIIVLADVSSRDRATRARYTLRYRVELVRRDRWLVQALSPSQEVR